MILNLTKKQFADFSTPQKQACGGHPVHTEHVTTIDEYDEAVYRLRNVVTMVIVDPNNFILANDICNSVAIPVVTLDVEQQYACTDVGDCPMGWAFREYDPYEEG